MKFEPVQRSFAFSRAYSQAGMENGNDRNASTRDDAQKTNPEIESTRFAKSSDPDHETAAYPHARCKTNDATNLNETV